VHQRRGVRERGGGNRPDMRLVELFDVRWRSWVILSCLNSSERIAQPLAPHSHMKHEERGRPACGRRLIRARGSDEILLERALGFEHLADRGWVRQALI